MNEGLEIHPARRPPLDPLAVFESERGRLFGLAYRMLSSVSEAEDVLQDAWLRWHAADPATVERPAGFSSAWSPGCASTP